MDLEISGGTVKVDDETIREIVSELVDEALSSRTVEDAIRDEVRSEVSDQISEVDFTDYMDSRSVAKEIVGYISAADIDDIGEVVQEAVDEALANDDVIANIMECNANQTKQIQDLSNVLEAQAVTIGELQMLTAELTRELIRLKNVLRSV